MDGNRMSGFKLSVVLGLVLICLWGGCSKDDSPHDYFASYNFENFVYRISCEAQDVVLKLDQSREGLVIPEEWEIIELQYYTVENPYDVTPNSNTIMIDWTDTPIEYTQYRDGDGILCLKVKIPANHTSGYREIHVNAVYGHCFATARIVQSPENSGTLVERDVMRIRVDGQIYSSGYDYDEENGYEFSNPQFCEILSMVESDDKWRMVVVESDIVDYIDVTRTNLDEYLRYLLSEIHTESRADISGFQYMGSGDTGYFAVFDNGDFKGSNIYKGLTDLYATFYIQNLKDWGMNDKISSVAVAYNGTNPNLCAVMTLWDDADWNHGDESRSKHRLSVIASYFNRKVTYSSLKNVKCLNSSKNWNDRISSISCHFGYWGRSMLDY